MQDEGRSYHEESNFGSERKEGEMDKESIVNEERKEEAVGYREEVEGRT